MLFSLDRHMRSFVLVVWFLFAASLPSLATEDPAPTPIPRGVLSMAVEAVSRDLLQDRPALPDASNPERPREAEQIAPPVALIASDRATEGAVIGGIRWKPLLLESVHALAWQQTFRLIMEEQSRQRLTSTPMLRNWLECVKALDHWDDQGPFAVNYVAHPLMGSMAGRLLLNHDAHGRRVRPGDEGYWPSRMRALAFSAGYSTAHEIGPVSEAMFGLSPNKEGWVDFVITPTLGFAWLLAEDALEEHLVRRIERGGNVAWTRIARVVFTPSRMLANVAGLRVPWHRTDRGLRDVAEQTRAGR
jgi:hypothetical protein